LSGAERAKLGVIRSGGIDTTADGVRGRERRGTALDRGDERLIDRVDRVEHADGESGDVAGAERDREQERRQKGGRESMSVGSKEQGEQP